ncbi:spore-associated protein A [Nocardiopsis dassonvillei]|uniref:spore-associated protein A n=1 Tax=Nocardiopsis TaxID=2013 RepID=UPI00200E7FEC|nr:spore-associated protein A [Nocardiopsis dassonvillei]MCK9870665.1 spore-associated protein A [Nocardiopsis dassonvillei]
MRTLKKTLATAAATLTLLAAGVVTASPASAAAYNGACGSGYSVVNSAPIRFDLGTVFLTYNSSNGYNCVVTVRSADSDGFAMPMSAGLRRAGDGGSFVSDTGEYSYYAGPVYVYASGSCVDWRGLIGNQATERYATNCG